MQVKEFPAFLGHFPRMPCLWADADPDLSLKQESNFGFNPVSRDLGLLLTEYLHGGRREQAGWCVFLTVKSNLVARSLAAL